MRSQAPSDVMRYTPPADEPVFGRSGADIIAPVCGDGSMTAIAVISVETETVGVAGCAGSGIDGGGGGVFELPWLLTAAA